jgi:hypothetical protein
VTKFDVSSRLMAEPVPVSAERERLAWFPPQPERFVGRVGAMADVVLVCVDNHPGCQHTHRRDYERSRSARAAETT